VDRRGRIVVTTAVVVALVAPVALDRDSFPLSIYPMYSSARGDRVTFATAQAVDAEGAASTLTLGVIGESDDPLVVAGELREAIRDGRASERCVDIAERATRWDDLPPATVAIEVVTERHDVIVQVEGGDSLVDRTVHARCEVAR
jgi:hypothetical protein